MPSYAFAQKCKPFLLYKDMAAPSAVNLPFTKKANVEKLIEKISSLPEHKHFASVYARFKPEFYTAQDELVYLKCVYGYLKTDFDRDGVGDWKIASGEQLFSHLLPLDNDWDGDGIENLMDSDPLVKNTAKPEKIPKHLRLSARKNSKLNKLQDKILEKCRVLALNHTDTHSAAMLEHFLGVCTPALAAFKDKNRNFVLYAFSSHATSGDIIASFYAESNFMSIGGTLMDNKDTEKIKLTIAHEIGHFLTFNVLTPKELADAARKYGNWVTETEKDSPTSFFDPHFLKPAKHAQGFFPSSYSYTNIHEWFSEVFATILYHRLAQDKLATNVPSEFESWMTEKFRF